MTPEVKVKGSVFKSGRNKIISPSNGSERKAVLTRLRCTMICRKPGLHSLKMAVTDHKYDIFRPKCMIYRRSSEKCHYSNRSYILFRNPARARRVERPRKFSDSSPRMLFQDALTTIASVPEERGDARIANAFVPFITCTIIEIYPTQVAFHILDSVR